MEAIVDAMAGLVAVPGEGRMERQGEGGTTLTIALPLREASVLPFQELPSLKEKPA